MATQEKSGDEYLGYTITEAVAQVVADQFEVVNEHVKRIDDIKQNDDGQWELHFTQFTVVDEDPLQATQEEVFHSKVRVKELLRKSEAGEDLIAGTHAPL